MERAKLLLILQQTCYINLQQIKSLKIKKN